MAQNSKCVRTHSRTTTIPRRKRACQCVRTHPIKTPHGILTIKRQVGVLKSARTQPLFPDLWGLLPEPLTARWSGTRCRGGQSEIGCCGAGGWFRCARGFWSAHVPLARCRVLGARLCSLGFSCFFAVPWRKSKPRPNCRTRLSYHRQQSCQPPPRLFLHRPCDPPLPLDGVGHLAGGGVDGEAEARHAQHEHDQDDVFDLQVPFGYCSGFHDKGPFRGQQHFPPRSVPVPPGRRACPPHAGLRTPGR